MEALENAQPNVVIHLAGESVFGWWRQEKKNEILKSRVEGTSFLCQTLLNLKHGPPPVFISASGVNFYGLEGDKEYNEECEAGDKSLLLTRVTIEWEREASVLESRGVRVVYLRIGIVLSPSGGMLGTLLPPFKACLGGVMGTGNQYMPWISMHDALRAIMFTIKNDKISGPVNICAPNPVTNYTFTKTLGTQLGRLTVMWVPEIVLRFADYFLFFGMLKETALASLRVVPQKLLASGFQFRDVNLEEALQRELSDSS